MKRKVCLAFFIAVFLCGIFMMLTRGNPLDKKIGTVIITNGSDRVEVPGYKVSYNTDGKSRQVENPDMSEVTDIPSINYDINKEGSGISVSYSDSHTGDLLYSVYDENMNIVTENQTSLSISGKQGEKFYTEILVNWGSKDENVTLKYYFIINIV